MSYLDKPSLDYGLIEGSFARLGQSLIREKTDWIQVARFMSAVLLALGFAYGIGLTGGLITDPATTSSVLKSGGVFVGSPKYRAPGGLV